MVLPGAVAPSQDLGARVMGFLEVSCFLGFLAICSSKLNVLMLLGLEHRSVKSSVSSMGRTTYSLVPQSSWRAKDTRID